MANLTPTRREVIRIHARNCAATARQITGPAAEQLLAARDAINELLGHLAGIETRIRARAERAERNGAYGMAEVLVEIADEVKGG